jgi:integrase
LLRPRARPPRKLRQAGVNDSASRDEYAMAYAGHDTRLIQDWLGHRAIQHTARYTELSPTRFKEVWR